MEFWNEFLETVSDLLETEQVKELQDITHHLSLTCYEHSVFVAYLSFCTARKMGLDYRAAARAGLLHDLYLYDSATVPAVSHCFNHSSRALENAREVCELSEKEENIILAHMWPLSKAMPKSREAVVVSLCDKYCATVEVLHIWHKMKLRSRIPATGL